MNPQEGDPSTSFDAENPRKNGNDGIATYLTIDFGDETGIVFSSGLIQDNLSQIEVARNMGNGYTNLVYSIGI